MTRIYKRGLNPIPDLGLREDIADMCLDGLGAQEKFLSNFFVGHAFAE